MKIALGSDRNGFEYKNRLIDYLKNCGYEVVDVGTKEFIPCDSPVFAAKVGKLVSNGECDFGILICATGSGMVMAANKIKGILCGIGYDDDVTRKLREHNDANIIAFGQLHMLYEDVERRTGIFLNTKFIGGHHLPRVNQIRDLEDGKEILQTRILNNNWRESDKGKKFICEK